MLILMVYNIYNYYYIILISKFFLYFIDENEIHNNPNLHSEEQNELEIPDSI